MEITVEKVFWFALGAAVAWFLLTQGRRRRQEAPKYFKRPPTEAPARGCA